MRKTVILFGAAISLAACRQSADNKEANNAAANSAASEKPRPAYCFFKDSETKAWKVKVDRDGNVVVSGKAYRQDSRYKVVLSPATVTGNSAELSPTIVINDTGFGAPENWWDVSATIPNSAAVTSVTVSCGARTLAKLDVAAKS